MSQIIPQQSNQVHGIAVNEAHENLSANELVVAKNIHRMLQQHYPGFNWGVNCNNGVFTIVAQKLSMRHGFHIHQSKLDDGYRKIIYYAGELLERFKQSRRRANADSLLILPRDLGGNAKPDV